jgi:DNA primase
MQAFDEKLAAFFAPVRQSRWEPRGQDRYRRDGYRGGGQRRGQGGPSPRLVVSDTLRNSRLLKPGRNADVSPREATILMSLVNHPHLAEHRLEALAALDFASPAARGLLSAFLDIVSRDHETGRDGMVEALGARGMGETLQRMETLLARQGIWQSAAEIAEGDAEIGLKHALALHYKSVELNRELKAAETALGTDPSEETFERLKDIQSQITTVDGTEALIEGFGSLSGRATRGF